MRRTTLKSAVLCGVLLSIVAGRASDRAVIQQANQFHGGLEKAVMDDRQLDQYINRVGDRIITAARDFYRENPERGSKENRDWMFSNQVKFHFVNSKTLNAFTTGGEHMYIYNELFQTVKSEDEMAAVMAHEFAHIYGRHVQSGMNRQMAILGAAGLVGAGGYAVGGSEKGSQYAGMAGGLAAMAGQMVGMYYSRGDEAEADSLGFDFYVRAGYDPEQFDNFFQTMIDMGYDKGNEMLSGHPSLSSRVATARKRVASLPAEARQWRKPAVAEGSEFRRLQQHAREVGRDMPTDETLANTQELLAAMPRSCLTPAIHQDQQEAEVSIMRKLHGNDVPPDQKQDRPTRQERRQERRDRNERANEDQAPRGRQVIGQS